MNLTQPKTQGTIAEFMLARQGGNLNAEQLEAFAVEFYNMNLQLVQARENCFTIRSEQAFPIMDTLNIDVAEFLAWSFRYWAWIAGLESFERECLATVEVSWE